MDGYREEVRILFCILDSRNILLETGATAQK
jgi:hypothetical protein